MDILSFHHQLIANYQEYIRSFLNIKDARIAEEVNKGLEDRKLWPEPLKIVEENHGAYLIQS